MYRTVPYVCQICGQVEPLYFDEDLEAEYYSDDPEHDTLEFWIHEFPFPTCTMKIRACGECSTLDDDALFETWKKRCRAGEIPFLH